ncbi:hypothetical protein ENSA5_65100 [Enhygromyxa salina]|uniref:Uncharacterized protein n=1 Tax=Enhygromyxa salina TaxID=215803 RepID=A0A2S9XC37_9BACT|nr:hypothetical protein [Enhygromyxa salina]PRP90418.1 hypothetical protein ENSA5_65100 [Enhygromyxa salina]
MNKLQVLEDIRLPNTSLKVTVRVTNSLLALVPGGIDSVAVSTAASRLGSYLGHVNNVFTERLREGHPELATHLLIFDRGGDGLWTLLDRRLLDYEAFEHEGLDLLPAELAEQVQLSKLRERAGRARDLRERLFGPDGAHFTRLGYFEQAESMATVLRLIKEDDLSDDLAEVVGPELPALLAACQVHYEALLDARLAKKAGVGQDLRPLRNKLRRLIHRYRNALVNWVDEDQPKTIEVAWQALLPLTTVRAHLSSPTRPNDDELIEALDAIDGLDSSDDTPGTEPGVTAVQAEA